MADQLTKVFLTAEWRQLAMLNYAIEPALLKPWVPRGTELDSWNGQTFVSMVGFLFLNTRVWGIRFPFHQNFEEVNLRFYVRRRSVEGWRRGVVFIKEIVPRAAIALAAKCFYGENYVALRMGHQVQTDSAEYSWRTAGRENRLSVLAKGEPQELKADSEAEFITEHYWGYSRRRDGSTTEYRVEHPRWRVRDAIEAKLDCDVAGLYGKEFVEAIKGKPSSAFSAEGSGVIVRAGTWLK